MKDLNTLNEYRDERTELAIYGVKGNESNGVFSVPDTHSGRVLRVIASDGGDWEHVSVSLRDRCPTWDEMERIKRMFFNDDETCVQYHVPPAEHVNMHPYCLHIWHPSPNIHLPRPPAWMVGV